MAKVTKPSAKSSSKSSAGAKAAPKKLGSPSTAPAEKKNGKPAAAATKAADADRLELPKVPPMPKAPPSKPLQGLKPTPDASVIRAHVDAKLTKQELNALYSKLVEEKSRVLGNFENRVDNALAEEDVLADEIDIAQRSTDQAWLFRMADKDRKLLIEIEAALEKMHTGEYGVCEGTDEPIGFKRLELRPWTRYSVGYKEMLEREKAQQAR